MRLTAGTMITSLVLIGFSFFIMQLTPSGDCTKLYQDKEQIKKCNAMQSISSIIVLMTVIIVMLIIVGSIFSKEEESKTERPWKTLPKGFSTESQVSPRRKRHDNNTKSKQMSFNLRFIYFWSNWHGNRIRS